eukprot:4699711-Alexandrium_andersonii.AAC.1
MSSRQPAMARVRHLHAPDQPSIPSHADRPGPYLGHCSHGDSLKSSSKAPVRPAADFMARRARMRWVRKSRGA